MENYLSVVIPALNAEDTLAKTLDSLIGPDKGVIREIIVVDGGSADRTLDLARERNAHVLTAARGRGQQLGAGADTARGAWLLFLHADTRPEAGWPDAVRGFISNPENRERAAVFRLRMDDDAPGARRVERLVSWRVAIFGLPYGDQGLLIARDFYDRLGGYRPIPLFEDVDIVRRIGNRRLRVLPVAAVTSADRYRREGWWRRPLRNLACLTLYFLGVPPRRILGLYR